VGGRLACEVARTGDISGSVADAPMISDDKCIRDRQMTGNERPSLKVQSNIALFSPGASLFCSSESNSLGKLVQPSEVYLSTTGANALTLNTHQYALIVGKRGIAR
jgi:hypothetical protein